MLEKWGNDPVSRLPTLQDMTKEVSRNCSIPQDLTKLKLHVLVIPIECLRFCATKGMIFS